MSNNSKRDRLSESVVRQIAFHLARGERADDVAAHFGVSTSTARDIGTGRTHGKTTGIVYRPKPTPPRRGLKTDEVAAIRRLAAEGKRPVEIHKYLKQEYSDKITYAAVYEVISGRNRKGGPGAVSYAKRWSGRRVSTVEVPIGLVGHRFDSHPSLTRSLKMKPFEIQTVVQNQLRRSRDELGRIKMRNNKQGVQ